MGPFPANTSLFAERTIDLTPSQRPTFFYGYWIVATAFFCAFVHSGCGFYAYSLFVTPLQAEFGWGRGGIMLALTIFFLIAGMSAPAVGRFVDRFGAKSVIVAGAFFTGVGFVLLSLVHTLWFFYAGYVVVGFGMAATGMVPATAVVSNWFEKWRGTALGIMSAGIGGGGFVLAPLIGAYLIPHFGWRIAFITMAVITWLLIPMAIFALKTKPEDMGLYPDGRLDPAPVIEDEVSSSATQGLTLKMALTTTGFWLIAVSFMAHAFGEVGVLQTHIPYLEDVGFPLAEVSTAFGVLGLFSLIGKLFFGWLCDRIQGKSACAIGLGVQLAGLFILLSIRQTSPTVVLYLFAVVMGLGVGSWLPAMSMIVSANFGLVAYGAIFGTISFSQSIGAAVGPLMAGQMFDVTGNYNRAFIIFIISYGVAIPTVLAARRPKSPFQMKNAKSWQ